MAEKKTSTRSGERVPADLRHNPSTTMRVAAALAYTRAFDRGAALELDDLHTEVDRAKALAEASVDETEQRAQTAALRGYEHALIFRMRGEEEVPRTFTL